MTLISYSTRFTFFFSIRCVSYSIIGVFYWCVTFSISCDRFSISCTCYVFAILCLIFDPLIVHFRLVVHLTFLSLALKLYDKLSFFSVLFFSVESVLSFFFSQHAANSIGLSEMRKFLILCTCSNGIAPKHPWEVN